MLPSMDMKGKVLIQSLCKIPVCFSAKAAKQNIFASDDVLSSSIMLASVAGEDWMLEIKILVDWLSQRAGLVSVGVAICSGASLCCVLLIPIFVGASCVCWQSLDWG